jgi:hypothetical protein
MLPLQQQQLLLEKKEKQSSGRIYTVLYTTTQTPFFSLLFFPVVRKPTVCLRPRRIPHNQWRVITSHIRYSIPYHYHLYKVNVIAECSGSSHQRETRGLSWGMSITCESFKSYYKKKQKNQLIEQKRVRTTTTSHDL